jgi:uncharacterized lipoprotein YbaY
MSEEKPLVSGSIILGGEVGSFAGVTVYVRLEDISRADAPAVLMAEHALEGVSHQAGTEDSLDFALYGLPPAEGADCNVSVHVDVDGDGEVSRGDYITVESYPVITRGAPDRVRVRLEKVG